MTLVKNNVMKD